MVTVVVIGQWSLFGGHRSMVTVVVSGQWSLSDGHQSMVGGQWSMVSGQSMPMGINQPIITQKLHTSLIN